MYSAETRAGCYSFVLFYCLGHSGYCMVMVLMEGWSIAAHSNNVNWTLM